MLEVRLLGRFEVGLDGKTVDIPSRPAQSALAFLLLNAGRAYPREVLAGLFWPDTTDASARGNLRRTLWYIRRGLEEIGLDADHFLLADHTSVAFKAGADYWLDTAALEKKVGDGMAADEMITLVSAYGGDFLPGFYEDWVLLQRERLQALFEQKMKLLLDRLVADGRWAEVQEWGERWIALGSTPEPAYRALMTAHSSLGDLTSMAAVYQRCVESLARELGVEPSEQTRALYEQLSKWRPVGPVARGLTEGAVADDEPPTPGEPPYKGLQYFDEEDADLFFGRELLTAKLVGRLRQSRFLAVIVGASGSGKSSVVRAGIVSALRQGRPLADGTLPPEGSTAWPIHVITPTTHPLESLAVSLTQQSESVLATAALMDDMAGDPRSLHLAARRLLAPSALHSHLPGPRHTRFLLVVDQFEELFTLCRDDGERRAFINNLLAATALETAGPTVVIVTLRADFYPHCAQYPNLREAVAHHQEYIGPMSAEELRRAVEEPARRGDWEFEPGLVDLILHDVGDEPGALPLLSHALLEAWKRRRGRTLTLAGYGEAGGVRGAISQTAERVYQALTPEQQGIARSIFLRLTELGEGAAESGLPQPDTRRRASLAELISGREAAAMVLQVLADARLITTAEETAEVAHEALIREWPTLRRWLMENGENLRLHRRLTEAVQTWAELEREPGALYRGARLAQAREWADAHPIELNALEREFLAASTALAEQRAAEREAQQQRELESAQRLVQVTQQRARILSGALIVVLILSLVAALLAQRASRAAALAETQARLATARELAAAAINNLAIDAERGILLALQAVATTYDVGGTVTAEAEDALHRAILASRGLFALTGHDDRIVSIAYSPDGQQIATASLDETAKIWDAKTGAELLTLRGHGGRVVHVEFSPDGQRLVTASADLTARVWDALSGEEIFALTRHDAQLFGAHFSPDGQLIATASADNTVKLWDAATGRPLTTLRGHTDTLRATAFSPDGTLLATTSQDRAAKIWEVASGEEMHTLQGHTDWVLSVAFSPDGKVVVTGGQDGLVKMWDVASGQELDVLDAHNSSVHDLAFSPDGTSLVTASGDGTARVWDVASGQGLFALLGHNSAIRQVAFDAGGRWVATAGGDGTARVWDAKTGQELFILSGHVGRVERVGFSPDGEQLATLGEDGQARIWDTGPQGGRELFNLVGHTNRVNQLAFSPDGSLLASVSNDHTARVWAVAGETGREVATLSGHTDWVAAVAFHPDGERVATSSRDGLVIIWEARSGREIKNIKAHPTGASAVAFSSDGALMATGGGDGLVKLWRTDTWEGVREIPAHPDLVIDVAFSPNDEQLATLGQEGTIKLWDVNSGQMQQNLPVVVRTGGMIAYSPDGTRLAIASADTRVVVGDVVNGQEYLSLGGHTGRIFGVAYSPDGTRLATVGGDSRVKVWDAHNGQELLTLYGHTGPVFAVAFSPDGTRLATAGRDWTIRFNLLNVEDLIELARSRVSRPWTAEECLRYLHVAECPAALQLP